jgi:hypothetical protein
VNDNLPERAATLRYGGPPITTIWAWVVTDPDGKEAIARSPWSESGALIGPDEESIATPQMRQWCEAFYGPKGITVELRRFDLVATQ